MAITPYADLAYADAYFADLLYGAEWESFSASKREKALAQATRSLDRLNWRGRVNEAFITEPGRAWPRAQYMQPMNEAPTETVPDSVRVACAETALAILQNRTEEALAKQGGEVSSERIGNVSVSYRQGTASLPALLRKTAGLGSLAAYQAISIFLADGRSVRFTRIN